MSLMPPKRGTLPVTPLRGLSGKSSEKLWVRMLANQHDNPIEIEQNIRRFDLDVHGFEPAIVIGIEIVERISIDLLVFLSRCGGAYKVDDFYERLKPSSFIVLMKCTNELYRTRQITSDDAGTIFLTLKGMMTLEQRRDRYRQDAARRNQTSTPFTDPEAP